MKTNPFTALLVTILFAGCSGAVTNQATLIAPPSVAVSATAQTTVENTLESRKYKRKPADSSETKLFDGKRFIYLDHYNKGDQHFSLSKASDGTLILSSSCLYVPPLNYSWPEEYFDTLRVIKKELQALPRVELKEISPY